MAVCPICAGHARRTGVAIRTIASYRVHKCRRCGLAFTVPRPTPEDLAHFYTSAYFSDGEGDYPFGYVDHDGASLAALNARKTWIDLQEWGPQTPTVPLRRLLDVGAATGDFAACAREDGWQTVACEISDYAREKAQARGLDVVEELNEAQGPFGLITMFHVLEHLPEPDKELRLARELIDEDGLLVVELPQWYSLGRILRRSNWAQLKPPEHINYFGRRSMARALQLTGWAPIYNRTVYPRSRARALQGIRRRDVKEAAPQAGKWLAGGVGVGGYLRVIARPA